MSDNLELFAADHADIGRLFDQLDSIPFDELKNKWPQTLADILDALECELNRQKIDNAKIVASKLTAVIAHYFGGRAVYLPTGENLTAALRDYDIFANWNGDIGGLMKKYGLTESHIYGILRQQLRLHRGRNQLDMFKGES